jgi:hypothetical protein
VQGVHRRVEPLEVLPAVLAAVDAVIGSGQNAAGLFLVDCEAEHAAFGPQSGRTCRQLSPPSGLTQAPFPMVCRHKS